MSRKGRSRKPHRTRTGRAVSQRQSITTPEIESMRRGILGDHDKHSKAYLNDQRLGSTWGRMNRRGLLTERQFQAAEAVANLWRTWSRGAESPPRHARAADLPVHVVTECASDAPKRPVDADEEGVRWGRTSEAMNALRDAVNGVQHFALAWSLLQSVCADDMMPRTLEQSGPLADKCWAALRNALDAAAGVFKIPDARAA